MIKETDMLTPEQEEERKSLGLIKPSYWRTKFGRPIAESREHFLGAMAEGMYNHLPEWYLSAVREELRIKTH
jgi:hypothetical protein